MEKGVSLEDSFNKHKSIYPDFYIKNIAFGEKCGRLNDVLLEVEKIYTKQDYILKKVISSSIYPIFLVISMLLLIIALVLFGIPIFYNIYESMGSEIPSVCLKLYTLGAWIKENTIVFILGTISYLILCPYLVIKLIDKNKVKYYISQKFIFRYFTEYMFLLHLNLSFKSGIPLIESLNLCSNNITSSVIKTTFKEILTRIYGGYTLYDSIEDNKFLSKHTKVFIKIGEESGSLEERLEFACKHVENYLMSSLDSYMKALQPISIIFMGIFIAFFLFYIVLPLFSSLYGGIH